MKRECESCIKRKTAYCPTSMKCMATDDMPYYQNRIMLLEENKQLKDNWNKLKEDLINDINDRNGTKIAEFEDGNRVSETISPIYTLMEDKSKTMKEVLDKMQEIEKERNSNVKD